MPADGTRTAGGVYRHAAGFFAFSHGWTWILWALAASLGTSVWEAPGVYFFIAGGAGVMIGGIVMSRVTRGPTGLRDLGWRAVDTRRIGSRWWAVILLFFPALTLLAALLAATVTGDPRPIDPRGAAGQVIDPAGLLAMMGFILVIGPLPEEIGWRGYLQDRLQERWSALAASGVVGLAWWTWHLPLFLLPGFFDVFDIATPTPLGFLAGILPSAVLYAWVYNNTGRSVLAVILFHFMQNFSGEILAMSVPARVWQVGLMWGAAAVVIWWWGRTTLTRQS